MKAKYLFVITLASLITEKSNDSIVGQAAYDEHLI